MFRLLATAVLLAVATGALAAKPSAAPPMSAAQIVDASAAGAVIAATCAKGTADVHRRNAQADARAMLQARHQLPADFDARFMRAWSADSRRMKALTPAQRSTVCRRLEAQGMHFKR
jgi:hypothetical protein